MNVNQIISVLLGAIILRLIVYAVYVLGYHDGESIGMKKMFIILESDRLASKEPDIKEESVKAD